MKMIVLTDGTHINQKTDDAMLCLMNTPTRTLWIDLKVAKSLVALELATELDRTETRLKVRLNSRAESMCWMSRVSEWQYKGRIASKIAPGIGAHLS